ncbi:Cytochrome oxidase biogenesis protein Surf1, facilitates heme A insertion [Roseibacterium elongatum DSM 19469]|uniref:SURF1-like protein n=1 Tax=Roseicyclus elongatus DSM 19469 TaxID=1294273 RepID=W8S1D1_9RHOB|nr:SURF1 family protein [Roseibacterium elongatum]AHM02526.1 Cytochrome oxidase biogenesis protein Surf1, facilitates heme A insertion [Roseibacterium elongatum DSM 19469]
MRRVIWPLVFGIGGVAILVSLGIWQVQRLAWKEAMLAEIEAQIADAPVPLPETPDAQADRFLPVEVTGRFGDGYARVLVSQRGAGAGYRVISPFDTGARVILVDRGIMPTEGAVPAHEGMVTVTGNLHSPNEVDGFTPDPDLARNIWYARDVDALADHLGADPVFVIARGLSVDDTPIAPLPVTTEGIPNDHLSYAVTWFSLAVLWLGMTLYLLWRIRRRTV